MADQPWRSFYCADGDHADCKRDFGSVYEPGKEPRPLAVCECPCHGCPKATTE